MLKSGYEGVRELSNRLNYTLGWSATSGQVDNFVYEETNETFINDEEMRKRLMDLNPNSFRRIVGTLLEVNGRGYWETSDENIDQLKELYQEVEDKIEGIPIDLFLYSILYLSNETLLSKYFLGSLILSLIKPPINKFSSTVISGKTELSCRI